MYLLNAAVADDIANQVMATGAKMSTFRTIEIDRAIHKTLETVLLEGSGKN